MVGSAGCYAARLTHATHEQQATGEGHGVADAVLQVCQQRSKIANA